MHDWLLIAYATTVTVMLLTLCMLSPTKQKVVANAVKRMRNLLQENPHKMVLVVRTDIGMTKGKAAAQVRFLVFLLLFSTSV